LDGGGCFAHQFPHIADHSRAEPFDRIDEVRMVTTHFNPLRNERQRATYYEWLPSLGPLADHLHCIELVFDDDEPEIAGSQVIRGTRAKNWMWQKEALLNVTLRQCPPEIQYFAWLDHDMVLTRKTWLADAIEQIDGGKVAVQLFDEVRYLNMDKTQTHKMPGRAATGKGNPGGMWIADRNYLDAIGGFHSAHIVGGGDQWSYAAMVGDITQYLSGKNVRLSLPLRNSVLRYYQAAIAKGHGVGYIGAPAMHLYHGSLQNKQYATRDKILQRHAFDPEHDVQVNAHGVLEWSSAKPHLHTDVRRYFEDRREDG
jgi:hypothetical protein